MILRERNLILLEIITCDPSIYTMDHPNVIVPTRKKYLLLHKGFTLLLIYSRRLLTLFANRADSDQAALFAYGNDMSEPVK